MAETMSAPDAAQAEPRRPSTVAKRSGVSGWSGRRRWILAGGVALALAAAALAWPWIRVMHCLHAARAALERGDPAAALPPLLAAEQVQPQRAVVQYLLAVAYRRGGQLDRFRPCLQAAQELGWSAEDTTRQEWLAVAQAGDVDAVRDRLLETIDRGVPDEAAQEIYEAMARGYLTSYRLRDAWNCLEMWLEWRPAAPQARLMRAYVDEQLGQIQAAVEDYRAALAALPDCREAHLQLAALLVRQTVFDEAESHYRACLVANPGDLEALLGAARTARAQGNHDEARRCLEAALRLDPAPPQQADALAELGRMLLEEGQTGEALNQLTQAVQLAPAEVSFRRILAAALTRAGNAEQAKLHFDRAREIEAKYNRMGDIQRALIDKPNDAALRCEAGQILIEQGLTSKGIDWLLTAVKCDAKHRPSHQLLAAYYAAAGDQARAAHHRLLAARAPPPK